MINKIKNVFRKITDTDARTLGLLVIVVVAISVTYSSAKIIQKNYILQQDIAKLKQENSLQEQINKNQELKNEYFKTDAYLDIAARRYTNRVAPGEKLYLVPEEVALKYIKAPPADDTAGSKEEPQFIKNWRKWLDFLSGKPIES